MQTSFEEHNCNMGDWKNTEWQKKLKNKPLKYWIRDEIEEIIKEENIDRNRFGEFSKLNYEHILKKFHYTFMDYYKYPKIELSYCWMHFRPALMMEKQVFVNGDWIKFMQQVSAMIEQNRDRKLYMLLSQGWVYEGHKKEIFNVLRETDYLLEDFYIFSPDFDWLVSYCDDGEVAALYKI